MSLSAVPHALAERYNALRVVMIGQYSIGRKKGLSVLGQRHLPDNGVSIGDCQYAHDPILIDFDLVDTVNVRSSHVAPLQKNGSGATTLSSRPFVIRSTRAKGRKCHNSVISGKRERLATVQPSAHKHAVASPSTGRVGV